MLGVDLTVDGEEWAAVAVYAPVQGAERLTWLESDDGWRAAQERVREGKKVIMGGDWNCVAMPGEDTVGSPNYANVGGQRLENRWASWGMWDVWRHQRVAPLVAGITRWRGGMGSRIDRILVSANLQKRISKTEVRPCALSDHSGVWTKLKGVGAVQRPRTKRYRVNRALADS